MSRKTPDPPPRKRRTREHVVADMSRVHVEAVVVDAGFTAEPVRSDYGYDLVVTTYDPDGYVEPGRVLLQLKAGDTIGIGATPGGLAFDLDVKDHALWTREPFPVFLVLFDAVARVACWLYVQHYFEADPARRPKPGAKTVRVRVPVENRVDAALMAHARERKARVLSQAAGVIRHVD